MTPQELKLGIIQLALQGKISNRESNDSSVFDLIKSLPESKKKKYDNVLDEEKPFDIPESWQWVRLGILIDVISGVSYDKGHVCHSGLRILRGGNIHNNVISINDDDVFLPNNYFENDKIVRLGDTIIVASTGSKEVIGKPGFVKEPLADTMIGAFLRICRPKLIEMKEYLNVIFQSNLYRKRLRDLSQGTNINNVKESYITELPVPLPLLEEQKRIVKKIEELLPLVERYEEVWNKLERFNKAFPEDMEKSILQFAIQGELVKQISSEGHGDDCLQTIQKNKNNLIKEGKLKKTRPLPMITDEMYAHPYPSTWRLCYLDDIAFITKLAGFEFTKYIAPNLKTEGIPLFKGKNVQNGKLVLSFESYITKELSDVLWRSKISKKCLLTPYVGTIGNIAIFDGSFEAHLGSNVGKIELLNNPTICVLEEYVLYYLRSRIGYEQLSKFKKATAQESISIDAIRNVIIPIPPLEEQKRIVAKLEELLPLCRKLIK